MKCARSCSCCCSSRSAARMRSNPIRRARCASSCRSRPAASPTRRRACWRRGCPSSSAGSSSSRTSPARAAPSARTSSPSPRPTATRCCITGTPHVISAHLYKKLPYDALKDFTHIALMASGPYVLVVNPQKLRGELGARADRAGQGAAGQDRLRELGQRQRAAPGRRAVQLHGRRRAQPRALQGQRPGDAGPDRRAGGGVLRRRAERARRTSKRAACRRSA